MDVIHRRAAAWGVFVAALSLTCIGIVMVYSASSVAAQAQYHDGAFFLKRQIAFAIIGLGVMSVAWKVHYARLRRWALPLMCLAVLAVTIVLFPHVGRVAGGARRWVSIGGAFNIQPAEMAKLALILYLSNFLANRGARVREFGPGLVPPLIVFLVLAIAILRQPDLGSVLILAMITGVMLFVGGARIEHLLGIGCLAVPAVLAVILREGYRSSRLLAFLDPWKDPQGTGFHIIQSWLALGSGGVAGLGLGQSTQKFFYLIIHIPEADLVDMVEYLYSLKNPPVVPTSRLEQPRRLLRGAAVADVGVLEDLVERAAALVLADQVLGDAVLGGRPGKQEGEGVAENGREPGRHAADCILAPCSGRARRGTRSGFSTASTTAARRSG